MKQIFCYECHDLVGELSSGSKIKKGTQFICDKCATPAPTTNNSQADTDTLNYLKSMFGMH